MKSMVFAILTAGALVAQADSYMYWMIDEDATVEGAVLPSSSFSAKVVAINGKEWVQGGGTYLALAPDLATAAAGGEPMMSMAGAIAGIPYVANLASTGSGWTYFVELYNDGGIFAHSSAMPYDQGSVAAMGDMAVPGKMSLAMSFVAAAPVPEPTSALLMLLGCAGLALRRRRPTKG